MDGLDYYEDNNTNCLNISENVINQFPVRKISSIISIPLLLVPTLILQLFFIYRYKSTFLHRQFLYTTVVVLLLNVINIVYPSSLNHCPLSLLIVYRLNWYFYYVEMLQIATIHLLLLYKLCKHMQTKTTQRLQTLCCNIRPRLWNDVMIVCTQLGLPLPVLIVDIVVMLKTNSDAFTIREYNYFFLPLVAVNTLLGLVCIVLLVVWFCMLVKKKLLKSRAKFVCTQMGHILIVLVVLLIVNTAYFYSNYVNFSLAVFTAVRTIAPVSFGVYILISLPNLQRKTTTKAQVFATNRHTNPPSTRVSLPTDTAEHAPNFLSPSTAEPSEVTLLVND